MKDQERRAAIQRVLLIEGAANLSVLVAKGLVAVATGSSAILGDAFHSLADLANNGVALLALRLSGSPPDREHPYGHRKFETLAIFTLAVLLSVAAFEVALGAVRAREQPVVQQGWSLGVMLGVLCVNIALSTWQTRRARQLDSDLLRADSRHTLSDVLTTVAVILGWQLGAMGYPLLDRAFAIGVAVLILFLAYDLFRRAIPALVDEVVTDPDVLLAAVHSIAGVRSAVRVRSRRSGVGLSMDVVVTVDPRISTRASHDVADQIEDLLRRDFAADEVSVHVEPDPNA